MVGVFMKKRKKFDKHKGKIYNFIILFLVIAITVNFLFLVKNINALKIDNNSIEEIVIDPGHGGFDSGATGITGSIEKDINLNISLKLKYFFELAGYKVTMTREQDISIEDEKFNHKKKSDMRNRLKLIDSSEKTIGISIHQNKFTESQYSGAQIFYGSKNLKSQELADLIQKEFVSNLQPENSRQIKKGEKNLFLLHTAKNPIVLVECGFISNKKEEQLLLDDEYQNKVSFTIFSATMKFLSDNE